MNKRKEVWAYGILDLSELLKLQLVNFQGFFVEAGAFDGATDSTSLHFEIAHQWSGLLIEPVSRFFHLVVPSWGFTLAH